MDFLNKSLISTSMIILLTACGGGGGGSKSSSPSDGGDNSDGNTEVPEEVEEYIPLNKKIMSSWQTDCNNKEVTTVVFEKEESDYIFSYEIASHENEDCSDAAKSQTSFKGPFTYVELASEGQVENQLMIDALQEGAVLFANQPRFSISKGLDSVCSIVNKIGTKHIVNLMEFLVKKTNDGASSSKATLDKIVNLINKIPLIGNIIGSVLGSTGNFLINMSQFFLTVLFHDVIGNFSAFTGTQLRNLCDLGIDTFYERRVVTSVSVADDNLYMSQDFQICRPNNGKVNFQRWDHCVTDRELNFENPLRKIT